MNLHIDYLQFENLLNFKTDDGKKFIRDDIRKKWLVVQPEEIVRQLTVHYLCHELGYNKNKIKIEKGLKINNQEKRCDILIYNKEFKPLVLIECKRPEVNIEDKVFDQISHYNIALRVPFLIVTNGLETYCCKIDFENKTYNFLDHIPQPQ